MITEALRVVRKPPLASFILSICSPSQLQSLVSPRLTKSCISKTLWGTQRVTSRELTGPGPVATGTHSGHLESGLAWPSQPPLRPLELSHLTGEETDSQRIQVLFTPKSIPLTPLWCWQHVQLGRACVQVKGRALAQISDPNIAALSPLTLAKAFISPGVCFVGGAGVELFLFWFGLLSHWNNIYCFSWQKVEVLNFLKNKTSYFFFFNIQVGLKWPKFREN